MVIPHQLHKHEAASISSVQLVVQVYNLFVYLELKAARRKQKHERNPQQ